MPEFTHLHVHSQFSVLDGAASISGLLQKAKEYNMNSMAITDHGNLFGAVKFIYEAMKLKKEGYEIKPIIGCEIYVARRARHLKTKKVDRRGYHLILLAKNLEGYRNLSKLSSLGFKEENHYYTPRIDKELLRQYHKGLIASSACLGGEIPSTIMTLGEEKAEESLQEYLDIFGEDFYLELQNHGLPEQKKVNEVLVKFSEKYGTKLIATNDVHYINQDDYDAHNILICLNTGKELDDEEGLHYTGAEYFKSPEQMAALFKDHPEAISNTQEVVSKIEDYNILTSKTILPKFPIPEKHTSEDEYLRELTYAGAKKLYGEITDEIRNRIDYELKVISEKGFAGYFLIVQDFVQAAKRMGVLVGPGRGSAAGSAVAYCTGITNVDPIGYNLLFERFLNPERKSMPDIDIDFDDEGREKVFQYVVDKYGEDRVAQIITFGTMAARSSIRDVGRVLKLPLDETDAIAKMVPEGPGVSLKNAFKKVTELDTLRKKGPDLVKKTLQFAEILEGSNRNTGTHACGVIIGPDDLIDHIPLAKAKGSTLMVTQYEGKLVESVGMLKMDFLGLKTLSIIKDAIRNIKKRHNVTINIDDIPLDDTKTFELYQKGDTTATFQFESDGMRNYLKDLKPNNIEDLIAMNALYRPGPMEHIPTYIKRKHGREEVNYPHEWLEEILKPTYGIMVYQEQIMQTAQIIGGFTLGKADILRKAMGKKQKDVMEKQRVEFISGAESKGIGKDKSTEIFDLMEKFAEYGFNRSHSAAYSIVAYHTAYLKANYTAEYMAAVLTHSLNDIKDITNFIGECKRHNIEVLGPDINESELNFTVNDNGEIRFGMAAIKGIGETAVKNIVEERTENGFYRNIFDLTRRINLRSVNRRNLEALAKAGAFDTFEGTYRSQYFYREPGEETTFLEKVVRNSSDYQAKQNEAQGSLFGEEVHVEEATFEIPMCAPWSKLELIKHEKEVTGFYISGHPLDDYRNEMKNFCNVTIQDLKADLRKFKGAGELVFAGMVLEPKQRQTANGKAFGTFKIEDYTDTIGLALFSEDYLKMKHLLEEGYLLLVKGKVKPRFNREEKLELRISSMMLLSEALEKLAAEIVIKFPLEKITEDLIASIKKNVKSVKGSCRLVIQVYDKEEGMSVEMPSPKIKVNCNEFVKLLPQLPIDDYKILT